MGTAANVLVGAASSFQIGAWVTAKGAATLSDVGFTKGGVVLDPKVELHQVTVDQNLGIVAAQPMKRELELKVTLAEATIENLRVCLAQSSSNVTGTAPNQTLWVDASAVAQYYQIQFVGKGLGTNATRTVTIWKAAVKEFGTWEFKKDGEQSIPVTFLICEETTSTTTPDSFMKIVET